MKIVATSDTHFSFGPELLPQGDMLLHAGDLMYTGYPDEWYARVDSMAALEYKHKILVPGNHDFHIQNYPGIAKAEMRRRGKTTIVDGGFVKTPDLSILTIPYVTGLDGWAYNLSADEHGMGRFLAAVTDDGRNVPDIVVSHGPMYRVLDAIHPAEQDDMRRQHAGSWELRRWFDKLGKKPYAFIHGHIHESYGTEVIDGCKVFNVAMCNRKYERTNLGMVILDG